MTYLSGDSDVYAGISTTMSDTMLSWVRSGSCIKLCRSPKLIVSALILAAAVAGLAEATVAPSDCGGRCGVDWRLGAPVAACDDGIACEYTKTNHSHLLFILTVGRRTHIHISICEIKHLCHI